jgi:hypothetical protein
MDFLSNEGVIVIGKALLIVLLAIFLGFTLKHLLRKLLNEKLLKKLFKDAQVYETSKFIGNVITETLQWIIILLALNFSLTLLEFDFFRSTMQYLMTNLPVILIFVGILLGGYLVSKFIASILRGKGLEHEFEIISLIEIVVMAAFLLTALEFIGIRASALIELYKVILYVIGALIVLIIIKPKILDKKEKKLSKKK